MSMLVVLLSASLQKVNSFQEMLLKSQQLREEWKQDKGTIPKGLSSFVAKGTLISFKWPLRWEKNS